MPPILLTLFFILLSSLSPVLYSAQITAFVQVKTISPLTVFSRQSNHQIQLVDLESQQTSELNNEIQIHSQQPFSQISVEADIKEININNQHHQNFKLNVDSHYQLIDQAKPQRIMFKMTINSETSLAQQSYTGSYHVGIHY